GSTGARAEPRAQTSAASHAWPASQKALKSHQRQAGPGVGSNRPSSIAASADSGELAHRVSHLLAGFQVEVGERQLVRALLPDLRARQAVDVQLQRGE